MTDPAEQFPYVPSDPTLDHASLAPMQSLTLIGDRRYSAMPRTQQTQEEIARIAEERYRREIRDKVMPQHNGKFLTLDIESGDYEIDEDDLTGEKKLRARHPDGIFFGFRIGYKEAYALSGGLDEDTA